MASNTLFPPIMDTYQPVFIKYIKDKEGTGECNIYFRFSSYNSEGDINSTFIQLSLTDPITNRTVLKTVTYPNEIKRCSMQFDKNKDVYWVTINADDYEDLSLNQYYKVQLRFVENGIDTENMSAEWLSNNASHFSEWSAVTLIRNIEQPILTVTGFTNDFTADTKEKINKLQICNEIQGSLSFGTESIEQDLLESYQIIITKDDGQLIEDSGKVYQDNGAKNLFNYRLKHRLKYKVNYVLQVIYTTVSGYSNADAPAVYDFILDINTEELAYPLTIRADADNTTGVIQVRIGFNESTAYNGRLTIYRTSYLSGFEYWDVLVDANIGKPKGEQEDGSLSYPIKFYYWNDTTAESGVVYKYAAEYLETKDDSSGSGGGISKYSYVEAAEVIAEFDDIFLENKNVQFKIKFDPTISNFKYVVNESITNTLGSKYPFIRRNGNNNYRQFNVGGLITFLAEPETEDDMIDSRGYVIEQHPSNTLFLSRNQAMKTAFNFYQKYNYQNGITDMTDYIFEKIYRDKAIEFLCDNTVKLYKSNTEGNILVRLTNISFTPTANLGRLTYSFSATATEIDECTIENYYKYDILEDPNDDYDTLYVLEAVKQQGTTAYVNRSEFLSDKVPDDRNVLQLRQIIIKK